MNVSIASAVRVRLPLLDGFSSAVKAAVAARRSFQFTLNRGLKTNGLCGPVATRQFRLARPLDGLGISAGNRSVKSSLSRNRDRNHIPPIITVFDV